MSNGYKRDESHYGNNHEPKEKRAEAGCINKSRRNRDLLSMQSGVLSYRQFFLLRRRRRTQQGGRGGQLHSEMHPSKSRDSLFLQAPLENLS